MPPIDPPVALKLDGICKSFDGFVALDQASFAARRGEVHAVLGENGAGKSSLMNIAAGLYRPEAGRVLVDGRTVQLGGPSDASAQGIGMVHQHFKLVRRFSVAENILLSNAAAAGSGRYSEKLGRIEAAIRDQATQLGFDIDPRRPVETLSIAEQQRVEILKVLLAGARILILDEPTAVLTDREAERLLQTVHELSRRGTAVVLVTHKMSDVKSFADRVTVMRSGRTITTVDPKITATDELVRLTVGDTTSTPPRVAREAGTVRLRIRGLRSSVPHESAGKLSGVDLEVRAGEIYGLAGVGGNGQSDLAAAIVGMTGELAGEIHIEGLGDIVGKPPHLRRDADIASIPADRYGLGLAGSLSVADNYAIGEVHRGRYGSAWRLRRSRLRTATGEAVRDYNVQGVRTVRQKAALLSGGNAQKLVIAREFGKNPKLVIAHSPSRGLDVRASLEVHARLIAARDAGAAVLLISEDLDEVLALADRVGVMSRGRIVAELPQPADRQAIGRAMVDHA